MIMETFKILDLFCGAGGLSFGLDSVSGFQTIIGVDFDKKVLETFKRNIKPLYTLCGDLTNDDFKNEIIKISKEEGINMIVGGPPCQGFSLKGKNLGINDPRNFLFKEFIKLVSSISPEVVLIENVKNLINSTDGFFINEIQNEFKSLGYIINFGVLNALNFGVPQHRERAIIIGSKSKSISLPIGNSNIVTVRDAISDLDYLNSGEGSFESDYIKPANSKYQQDMRVGSNKLYNHVATSHAQIALDKLKMIPEEGGKEFLPKELYGRQKFATTWGRLKWDSFSPTIDTRFDTPSNGTNSHPFLDRSITPREAARLQSFPDTFIFYGNKCSICKQIGNAVPPLLGSAIATQIHDAYIDRHIKKNKYEIYLSDSLNIVKEFINQRLKVDCILTDPPYNISKENNFKSMNNPRIGVDFGDWDRNFNLTKWIRPYINILSQNGSIIVFCSYLYISYICTELKNLDFSIKDIIVWEKTNPMPRNINRRYVQDKEFAIWACRKKAKWVFNKPNDVTYLRSSFHTPIVSGNEKTIHPTQKSLRLFKELVKIHTNVNDLILDPFMGSGTTGVAALENKRRFIGVEISPSYFSIAKNRLSNISDK